ncbi:Uncharacterised protein [Lederbergia lenta]|uniref:DoxX-like family protein n=1 Tax=Lederbergia lenta TaxID=1467 RepID=A0A2X4WFX1_LEDLE|nr:Uncharacterised protein [Lederbergia lenta]
MNFVKSKPIYVEVPIKTDIDTLWNATQNPDLHEQWDLRFSSITYIPKLENEVQEFLYKTKIGFGLEIAGWGKSVGSYHAENGSRVSSLHFGTDQKISIIHEGRGYWKYEPNNKSIHFLTEYNYDVNFGRIGSFFDHIIFRPLIGWATALSFDVLKRWLEKGESPRSQYIRFFSSWLITILFFFIWLYHGLIPKIIFTHPDEIYMLQNFISLNMHQAHMITILIGIVEILFGLTLLIYRHKRKLFTLQMFAFPFLATSALIANTDYLAHPFTPLTFNLALFVLSILGFIFNKDIPSAKSCKRKR